MIKDILQLGHVGVLMGGDSSEREISLKSGHAVYDALVAAGCRVTPLEVSSLDKESILPPIRRNNIDIVFVVLHGGAGEDGRVQAILESENILYTGSDSKSSHLAMDKELTQDIFKKNGIPVPDYLILHVNRVLSGREIVKALGNYPLVVKPVAEGSSVGINIVFSDEELGRALKEAFKFGDRVLVDSYIKGREMTAGILGDKALPLVEIRPKQPFFNFLAKYKKGMTDYIVPAEIPESLASSIRETALKAHRALGCRHFSRVDFILDERNTPHFLEINTIPGFTETSLLPMAAKSAGIEFPSLCLEILRLACQDYELLKAIKNKISG